MKSLVKENEFKIERFNIKYYLDTKNYSIAAALSALESTNELQKSFINQNKDNLKTSDHILNLYALLQGLFVSIDSLYALSFALTKSKNYININNNKNLRQLKYIRNDVVGHPSNRVLSNDVLAYCILDNESIKADEFSYNIYTLDSIQNKTIIISEILNSYYQESNRLLDELYKISLVGMQKDELLLLITQALDIYFHRGDYLEYYYKFVNLYKEKYKNTKHRVLWRFELIDELVKFNPKNELEKDTKEYCIGLELSKIYELVNNTKYKVDMVIKLPKYVSSFFRFLNKNKDLYTYLNYIKDIDHPMFYKSLNNIRTRAKERKANDALAFIDLIKNAYDNKNENLASAFKMVLKEYKKK